MLIEVNAKQYCGFFPFNPHPFISDPFIELNKSKAERIIRLIGPDEKPAIGLVAGVKNGFIVSPFSAPFGGFHFKNETVYISEIDKFSIFLKDYIVSQGFQGIELTLPPDIYHASFNAKTVNTLLRNGYRSILPEITNWVNLLHFTGDFSQRNSREYYRQAIRNGLAFELVTGSEEQEEIYDLICQNRARFGRPIYMTINDVRETGQLWPIDFFKVTNPEKTIVASAIFYRSHPEISYALFWGDNEVGRPLRAMDFLAFNLWSYYKNLGYKFIDLGISTETGTPNEGLLRFKESHDSTSSLRFKFVWEPDKN